MARRDAEEFTSFVVAHQAKLRRVAYLMCGGGAQGLTRRSLTR
jgi:DNA-directed RNA polymerase specialized sigma24 family protein